MRGTAMKGVAVATITTCAECGRSWTCDPAGECWCKAVEASLPLPLAGDAACLCPCRLEDLARAQGNRTRSPLA